MHQLFVDWAVVACTTEMQVCATVLVLACVWLTAKVQNVQELAAILYCRHLWLYVMPRLKILNFLAYCEPACWHSRSQDGACNRCLKKFTEQSYVNKLITWSMLVRYIEHQIAIIWLCYAQRCFAILHGFPNNATSLLEHVTFVYSFQYLSASCEFSAMFTNYIVDAMLMCFNKTENIQTHLWFT